MYVIATPTHRVPTSVKHPLMLDVPAASVMSLMPPMRVMRPVPPHQSMRRMHQVAMRAVSPVRPRPYHQIWQRTRKKRISVWFADKTVVTCTRYS